MEDIFPQTIVDLDRLFPDEEACRGYLARLRWPEGFVCPRCQGQDAWQASRGRWVCRSCRYQATVTAGTIFQDTRLPLRLWFHAIWQILSQKNGASAASVRRSLGLRTYKTAWTWLHKLRRAMVLPAAWR
jgi:transposase-like protein